jgi:hypothetical protein
MNLNNYTIEPEWMSNDYPNNIDDYIGNFYAKNVFEKWIKRFDKNLPEYKKINKAIFIWGKTGAGKSCIVKLMLKKYNYNPTELNVSNIKSPKSLSEIIKSFKTTSNVGMYFFKNYKKPCLLIEELDVLISERCCMQEITKLLTSDIVNTLPIIIVSNNIDKKLGELVRKYKCEQAKILEPTKADFYIRIQKFCEDYNIELSEDAITLILNILCNDYRHLLSLLQIIKLTIKDYKFNEENSCNIIKNILEIYENKKVDYNVFDLTKKILYNKNNINDIYRLYERDKLLLLLMIHENYKLPIIGSKLSFKDKINNLTKISDNLSKSDLFERVAYTQHQWLFYQYSGLYSCVLTNNILKDIDYKKNCDILFTNYLSKSSTFSSKNKLLNSMYDLNKNIQLSAVNNIDIISCKLKYTKEQKDKNKLLESVKITQDNYNKILSISTIIDESDYKVKKKVLTK